MTSEYEKMGALEIFLIVLGVGLFVITYLFSAKFEKTVEVRDINLGQDTKAEINKLAKEAAEVELYNIIDEKVENLEVKLDKMTTEKIMAVGNYAEESLKTIKKNHDEVMFLYSMLNEKEDTLRNVVRDIEMLKNSIKHMTEEEMKEKSVEVDDEILSRAEEELLTSDETQEKISLDSINKNDRILSLYETGLNNIEIAKQLGIGVGEVSLVIDLSGRKK